MVIKCPDQQQVTDDQAEKKAASAMPVRCHCHLNVCVCSEMWKRTVLEAAGKSKRFGAGKLAVCSLVVRRAVAFAGSRAQTLVHIGWWPRECAAASSPPFPISSLCRESGGRELQLVSPSQ